jgi:DNA-binding PadR family transcriptional regulator
MISMKMSTEVHMKGMLNIWIVYLLKKHPLTGYQILQEIVQFTGDTWHPTTGSVYPALHKLKKMGMISSKKEGARGKIEYSLTQKGGDMYEEMRGHVKKTMGNSKFRRVFESLVWPNEPEEIRSETEAIYIALVELRNNLKKADHKSTLEKLRRIRKQIEELK